MARVHPAVVLFLVGVLTSGPFISNAQTTVIKHINKVVTKTININGKSADCDSLADSTGYIRLTVTAVVLELNVLGQINFL